MRSLASRCLVAIVPAVLAISGCADTHSSSLLAPDGADFSKGKPGAGTNQPAMSISPTSATISVGGSTTVSVTYRDKQGNLVSDTDMRITYYGCIPVAPAGASCNDLLTITPVMPYLRQAVIKGVGAGQARLYASDGLGTYVYADLIIQ